ncbi:hypothetical protein BT69DRAFT_359424 [Atractiella rhizophila]|nr:hypothetical protein BT69DRAFT_359424 [Atractiella rhizophila]
MEEAPKTLTPYVLALTATLTYITDKEEHVSFALEERLYGFICDLFYPTRPTKPPESLEEYLNQLQRLEPKDDAAVFARKIREEMEWMTQSKPDHYYKFMNNDVKNCVPKDPVEASNAPSSVSRRSPFGLYHRRVLLLHSRLDWSDCVLLVGDVEKWIHGTSICQEKIPHLGSRNQSNIHNGTHAWNESYYSSRLLRLRNAHNIPAIPAVHAVRSSDLKRKKREDDRKRARNMESGHEWILISLAAFYLKTEGWLAAKLTLEEAFKVCKKADNSAALARCQSLLKHLPSNVQEETSEGQAEIDISPLPPTGLVSVEMNDEHRLEREVHLIDHMNIVSTSLIKACLCFSCHDFSLKGFIHHRAGNMY